MSVTEPVRILVTALGGQGGGTLMNWLVTVARNTGYRVQATSVPGVAQRTGSTSYYIELADGAYEGVFNLVPMPARVDVVICSEWIEAARVIEAGLVSPNRTTLIASTNRVYSTAEKIALADGRFDIESIQRAAIDMSKQCHLLDWQQIATDHATYISTTLFGAVAGSGALPFTVADCRKILSESAHSSGVAGFDAAVNAVIESTEPSNPAGDDEELTDLINFAEAELVGYQDQAYADLYRTRLSALFDNHRLADAFKEEVSRRLANWMMYEDIARVADLKTRPERFEKIKNECRLESEQTIRITEYLKPRAEEIADMLPVKYGQKLLDRVAAGKSVPFLGSGRRIPSNSAWGYWLLRLAARMKNTRRRSLRFQQEQAAIEKWLSALNESVSECEEFAMALAALPRLRKGYSDTLQRGVAAYDSIYGSVVSDTLKNRSFKNNAAMLQQAIDAALKDDKQVELKDTIVKFQSKESILSASNLA